MEILIYEITAPAHTSKAEWPSLQLVDQSPRGRFLIGKHVLTKSSCHRPHLAKSWVVKTSLRRFFCREPLGSPGSETNALPFKMVAPYRLSLVTASDDRQGSGWCRWVPWRANQNAPGSCGNFSFLPLHTAGCPPSSSPPPRTGFLLVTADHVNEGDRKETTYLLFSAVLAGWQSNLKIFLKCTRMGDLISFLLITVEDLTQSIN